MNERNNGKNKNRGRRPRSGVCVLAVCLCAAAVVLGVAVASVRANRGGAQSASSASSSTAAPTSPSSSSSSALSSSSPQAAAAVTRNIPVLMYHSVNYDPKNPNNILRVPKEKFAAEMKWLHDNGYQTLTLDEVYAAVRNNRPVPEKSVALTFDDGYADNYTNAYPVLKQYGFKATVFMITSKIGDSKDGYLTADQLKELQANGIDIECHTVHHQDLSALSEKKQEEEIEGSKETLESLLGKPADYIAYPSGKYDAETLRIVGRLGFHLAFRMNGGIAQLSDPVYEFPRFFVGGDLQDFIKRVTGQEDLRTDKNE